MRGEKPRSRLFATLVQLRTAAQLGRDAHLGVQARARRRSQRDLRTVIGIKHLDPRTMRDEEASRRRGARSCAYAPEYAGSPVEDVLRLHRHHIDTAVLRGALAQ